MSVRARVRKREREMHSAKLTDKVIAFSRTLRLRGKKERRKKTQEEEREEREALMKEEEMSRHEEGEGCWPKLENNI